MSDYRMIFISSYDICLFNAKRMESSYVLNIQTNRIVMNATFIGL